MKKLLNQAWTVIMVTVITALVWLYAEDANVKSYNNERVLVRFVAPDDGEMIIEPVGETLFVSLSGSTGQYQQFRRRVEENQVIEVPVPISPGQSSASVPIDLRRELEESIVLEELGLNLTELEPGTITVSARRVREVSLPVRVRSTGLNLAGTADASVEEVTVHLPSDLAEQVANAAAEIDLTAADLSDVKPGETTRMTLPIVLPDLGDLPEDFNPRVSATQAVVTFRLVVEREPYTVERLHVKLTGPASVGNRYVVTIPEEYQFLTDLAVQGPPEQIAQLRENPNVPNILATVEISNAEADEAAAGDGVVTKPVLVFISLPGVELESEPPRIPVQVRLREADPDTP